MNPPSSAPTSTRRRPRRTAEQWQSIINAFVQSDLSARRFCAENDIGYLSFSKWRKRLSSEIKRSSAPPAFIELNSLASSMLDTDADSPSNTTWCITLKLGNGVERCLNQAHVPA